MNKEKWKQELFEVLHARTQKFQYKRIIFHLSEFPFIYENHIKLEDFAIFKEVSKLCLKEQIPSHFPVAQVQVSGKGIILVLRKEGSESLRQAYNSSHEDGAFLKLLGLFVKRYQIEMAFTLAALFSNCQEDSVPTNFK